MFKPCFFFYNEEVLEVKTMFCLIIAIALIAVGTAFYTGIAVKYIKDYQRMDEKEKRNIKIRPLCKNISVMFFIAAAIFGVAGFSETFRQVYFTWCMVGWFALGVADVVYIGKSKRFVHRK